MDYLQILLLVCFIVIIIDILIYIFGRKKKNGYGSLDESVFTLVLVFFIVSVVVFVGYVAIYADSYTSALSLPQKYKSSVDTINETQHYLLKYENITDVAQGLEALQLKQTLAGTIKEKNDYAAQIRSWLNNDFMPFKDVLRRGLPLDFQE